MFYINFLCLLFRLQFHSIQNYVIQEGMLILAALPDSQTPSSAPLQKNTGLTTLRAQICCQGRNTYLETVFKILAKKTKLRHVNHMTQSLSSVHGCQLSRQAGRWLASILLVYAHFCLL